MTELETIKTFECRFTEYNGEQEYGYTKLVYAEGIQEARDIILKYLSQWYYTDATPLYDCAGDLDGYEFDGGMLAVRLKYITPINVKEFKEKLFRESVIGDAKCERSYIQKVISEAAEKITDFVIEALDGDETEKLGKLLTLELDKHQGNLTHEEYEERRKMI